MDLLSFLTAGFRMDLPFGGPLKPLFSLAMGLFPIVWAGGPVAFLVVICLRVLQPLVSQLRSRRCPRLTIPATVLQRETDRFSLGNHPTMIVWYATFQVDSGDEMVLSVPETLYFALEPGQIGRLTFQGREALAFTPDA